MRYQIDSQYNLELEEIPQLFQHGIFKIKDDVC